MLYHVLFFSTVFLKRSLENYGTFNAQKNVGAMSQGCFLHAKFIVESKEDSIGFALLKVGLTTKLQKNPTCVVENR